MGRTMPDCCDRKGPGVGDELRRILAARRLRSRRIAFLALTGLVSAPAALTAAWRAPTLLVWNATASAPVGLYRVESRAPVRRGDMVVAWAPPPARSLAAARHYVPVNVPLVKRVAALGGDRICAHQSAVQINGRRVARRMMRDWAGRAMPWWNGCRTLGAGDYFLLMDDLRSFDGRYFGVTRAGDLVGKARPLWVKQAESSGNG
jgi:conjugative transfer signal peptidase TraF